MFICEKFQGSRRSLLLPTNLLLWVKRASLSQGFVQLHNRTALAIRKWIRALQIIYPQHG